LPRGQQQHAGERKDRQGRRQLGLLWAGYRAAHRRSSRLGEEDRGETAARRQGQRVRRPHRLEELDELLARRLLVPLAIALDDVEQLVDRLLALTDGEEGGGEVEARLVILGVGGEAGAQLVERPPTPCRRPRRARARRAPPRSRDG